MTSRSSRGRWERVLEARRQARAALGRESDVGDLDAAPPKHRRDAPPALEPVPIKLEQSKPEHVLTLGEAAVRLGLSRRELEAMIERGDVTALQGEFIRMIPTREVERLTRQDQRR